jgi:hypothetical protein
VLAAAALGSTANEAFLADETIWVIGQDGHVEPFDAHLQRTPLAQLPATSAEPPDQ